jgi:beta-lactamase class A
MNRRHFLFYAAGFPLISLAKPSSPSQETTALEQFQKLELALEGRLGVFVLDTASGKELAYRADERFPFCSTFKMMLSAAILKRSSGDPELLERRIRYSRSDLVAHSPITEQHLEHGMTVSALCAATIQYSDNTAANLLIDLLGAPAELTAFARSIGDSRFRLDRKETELNTAIPGDLRDTTTPKAMGLSLHKLVLGDALPGWQREQLADWLKGNTTGDMRIKAGIPKDWVTGDKTGGGDYGTANDIAVLWPPKRPPIILCIFTTRHAQKAEARNDIIAAASKIAADWVS